jgi:hypothetical protein
MGDSKTEFEAKTKDLPFKWLEEKPDVLMGKIQAEIDGLNSLADVKAFLKKLALTYGKPLWCIVQEEFEK